MRACVSRVCVKLFSDFESFPVTLEHDFVASFCLDLFCFLFFLRPLFVSDLS